MGNIPQQLLQRMRPRSLRHELYGSVTTAIVSLPMAVLAAITVKVGIDILDCSFLGRAHRISKTSTVIMYAVLVLTVLVDLIVAVGVGLFVANILTIERLSKAASSRVKTIDPSGDPVVVDEEERRLLEAGSGRVVLFHLSGPMILGVAQAISLIFAELWSPAREPPGPRQPGSRLSPRRAPEDTR